VREIEKMGGWSRERKGEKEEQREIEREIERERKKERGNERKANRLIEMVTGRERSKVLEDVGERGSGR